MLSSELKDKVAAAISSARSLPRPKVVDGTLIISSLSAMPSARLLYNAVATLGMQATLAGPTEASVLLMPYRDFNSVIVFALAPRDSRSLRAAEEAAMMGMETYFVSPRMDESIEQRLKLHDNISRITVPGEAPLLTMMAASALWAPLPSSSRGERLRGELGSLDSALEWVSGRYADAIASASRLESYDVAYTSATQPGALYLCRVSNRCAAAYIIDEVSEAYSKLSAQGIVLLTTTAEDHDYRDVELMLSMRRANVIKIELNVDPVTAGLYAAFVAVALGGGLA